MSEAHTGYEVRALARSPYRARLGWGALAASVLALLALAGPWRRPLPPEVPIERCQWGPAYWPCRAYLPPEVRELPERDRVEKFCIRDLASTVLDPSRPSACRISDLQPVEGRPRRQALLSLAEKVPRPIEPPWGVTLDPTFGGAYPLGLLKPAEQTAVIKKSKTYAEKYEEQKEALQRSLLMDHAAAVDAKRAQILQQRARETPVWWGLAGLLAVSALGLLVAWQASRPVEVVISAGQVRLGARTLSLESVASWDFDTLSLVLTDGSRVKVGLGRVLDFQDALVLEEALALARERVVVAAPLDARSLAAVRELTP